MTDSRAIFFFTDLGIPNASSAVGRGQAESRKTADREKEEK